MPSFSLNLVLRIWLCKVFSQLHRNGAGGYGNWVDCTAEMDIGSRRRTSRGWGEVQHDLLHLVCDCLHPDARWVMRLVSAHWREASEQSGQQLVVNTTAHHLSTKIAVLNNWRTLAKFRDCRFSFVITAPVLLQDLAILVEHLSIQLHDMTSCSIGVTLLVAQDSNYTELVQSARQFAKFAHQLHQHQLAIGLSVQAATDTSVIPPPGVLIELGAYLCHFDTYSVPAEQAAASRTTGVGVKSDISFDHLWDLLHSNPSTCTLMISTDDDTYVPPSIKFGIVDVVASMTNLTKLHLTIDDNFLHYYVDFEPLAQLSLLQALALQIVHFVPTCCEDVLRSNKQTLQFITLTAGSWTAATYRSLQYISQLQVLNITIMEIGTAQAQALSSVRAELFRLTWQTRVLTEGPERIRALNNSPPEIHELTLRYPRCQDSFTLPELPSLRRLTLLNCHLLTGKSLPSYPQVTQLALIDCSKITGAGLQHIIKKALPALEVLSFHVSGHWYGVNNTLIVHYGTASRMSLHALNALHFGQNLHCIDLRGVYGLTNDLVTQLCNTMRSKQRKGKLQPCVTLLLPSPIMNLQEAVLESMPYDVDHVGVVLPNLYKLPTGQQPPYSAHAASVFKLGELVPTSLHANKIVLRK